MNPLDDLRRRVDSLRREIDQLARREVGSGSQDGSLTGGGTVATGGFTLTVPATGTASLQGVVVGARVYNNANISVAHNTVTSLGFNSERFDTDGLHSTTVSTDRLVAPVAGKYLITACVQFAANVTGERVAQIYLNDTTSLERIDRDTLINKEVTFALTTIYQLAATDYVTVRVYQDSGGALNVNSVGNYTPEFSMVLLSS